MKPIRIGRGMVALLALSLTFVALSAGDSIGKPGTDGDSGPSAPVTNEAPSQAQDGPWFTAQQAARGAAQYRVNCSSCHGTELEGVFAPGLSGGEFYGQWGTAGDLFDFFSVAMPPTNPGGLSDQAYTDILAFILSFNGYPSGEQELPIDPALFHAIPVVRME